MKNLLLSLVVLSSSPALARDIYLEPGESIQVGSRVVYCGQAREDIKWQCACFAAGGKNLGMVWGIWAPDQRQAEGIAVRQCQFEYGRQGYTTSTSCSKQLF